jgi:molybdopterin adenylyltransferase
MQKGSVLSVNISAKKGEIKKAVEEIIITEKGIENDAHAGDWHRQISLLAEESIRKFEKIIGRELTFGEFAENITTKGLILHEMHIGDRLLLGDEVEIEITQIGKECHGTSCAIFHAVGKCVMPKEGIFCKVIKGGKLSPNDSIQYIPIP